MELLFPVEGPLTSSQTASILEAGLTFVLYQRGQIPLPYKQLQMSFAQHKKVGEEEGVAGILNSDLKNIKSDTDLSSDMDISVGESTTGQKPRERISAMLMERKKRLLVTKLERRRRQALAIESKAYCSIQSSFEVLQRLLADVTIKNLGITVSGHQKKILSMALVLGPSLYSPKEVYCFDLPSSWLSDETTLISKVVSSKFENTVLRQFYKKIITNDDLMDFTGKPLGKTYAHICLVTLGDLNPILHGNNLYKDIIRLPTLPPSLHQMISSSLSSQFTTSIEAESTLSPPRPYPRSSSRRTKPNKLFKIKIQYEQRSSSITDLSNIEIMTNSKTDSFSGDILFDNNSFSCYQIPLRFKGVQCKNKRL